MPEELNRVIVDHLSITYFLLQNSGKNIKGKNKKRIVVGSTYQIT